MIDPGVVREPVYDDKSEIDVFYEVATEQLGLNYQGQVEKVEPFFRRFAQKLDTNDYHGALSLVQPYVHFDIFKYPRVLVKGLADSVSDVAPGVVPPQTLRYANIWSNLSIRCLDDTFYSEEETYNKVRNFVDSAIHRDQLKPFLNRPEEFLPTQFYDDPNQMQLTASAIKAYVSELLHKKDEMIQRKKEMDSKIIQFPSDISHPNHD